MDSNTPKSGAGLAVGFGLVVLGLIVFIDSMGMRVPPTYARVGPQAFPYFIAFALAAVGVYFIWNARSADVKREVAAEGFSTDWHALVIIAAGLLIHFNILKPLGFVISGVFLFLCVTFTFGSRKFLRDGIVAVILALVSYLGFTHGLGLQLPPGILAGLL